MKIATIVFTYNRYFHTMKVLEALKKNVIQPQELYVFQDGLKKKEDKQEWDNVQTLIKSIEWCEKEVIVSQYNKGLANSIIEGINYVLEKNDAIIVLEDDCVPSPSFLTYAIQCLEKYENNKKIYNITGYSWPMIIEKDKYDVCITGRTSSWGWCTWKDRWREYSRDYEIINRIHSNCEKSVELAIWGNDLDIMVRDRINNKNDSWAVFWALHVIEKGGLCISPFTSLIKNIGFDGSGIHCGKGRKFDTEVEDTIIDSFCLPDECEIKDDVRKAFTEIYGGMTVFNDNTNRRHAIVYGTGRNWISNEKKINEKYWIKAFVDRGKSGYYDGKKIIKIEDLPNDNNIDIIITLRDYEEASKIRKEIVEKTKIDDNKITIWLDN